MVSESSNLSVGTNVRNAIVVEQAYTAVREAAPERVWGFDSPRWHRRKTHEEEEETKKVR